MASPRLGSQTPGGNLGSSFSPDQLLKMLSVGGIGSGLASLFGLGGSNPADSAMPYYNQISGSVAPYLNPYMQAGGNALSTLQGQYGDLLNNPGGMINKIGSNFQQSPGYQFALNQALGSANRASAAGGMAGSPLAQQQNQQVATGLANQDYYNWLGNATDMYNQGLQGEQGIANMGYGASTDMARTIANVLASQGNLAYAGQANQNEAQGSAFGNLFGGLGSLLSLFGGK